jgi:proteasome lid subunit RPN8/RPN11
MRVVSLQSSVVADVVAHAREAAPAECCGLLLGHGDSVVEAMRARNASADPSRFIVDPEDHFRGRREARSRGFDVVGFYHSHPRSPAQPSDTDRAEAGYPDHLYLIVSLVPEPPEIRLFRFNGRNFLEWDFVTVD